MAVYAYTQGGHAQSSWRTTNSGVRFCQRFRALMGVASGGLTCLSHRRWKLIALIGHSLI